MTVPPMTVNLLIPYLKNPPPGDEAYTALCQAAYRAAIRRIKEVVLQYKGEDVSLAIEELKEENPDLVYFYQPADAGSDDLWLEHEAANGILEDLKKIKELSEDDQQLISFLEHWKKETRKMEKLAKTRKPGTPQELLEELAAFTPQGAATLKKVLLDDGVDLSGPLTRQIADKSVHDNFSDREESKRDNNDTILAFYLATSMVGHLYKK